MLKELVELGISLTADGRIPPTGFSPYSQPIRWLAHVSAGIPPAVYLEEVNVHKPRPMLSKLTAGTYAYPVAAEAGYALGIDRMKGGDRDNRAGEKHGKFLRRLWEAYRSEELAGTEARKCVGLLFRALRRGAWGPVSPVREVLSKDWVSFTVDNVSAPTAEHLFELAEVRTFWARVLTEDVAAKGKDGREKRGACAGCGADKALLELLPTKVKLFARHQLHSYNLSAFVSFVTGAEPHKNCHLGICLECGEGAAQALNFLADEPSHRRNIIVDPKKKDSLTNIVALFWLKRPQAVEVDQVKIDLNEALSAPLDPEPKPDSQTSATPRLSQLTALLEIPYTAWNAALTVDNAFYMAVVSPNVGRIAVRDWLAVSLERLRANLGAFLQALRLQDQDFGAARARTIPAIAQALRAVDPKALRALDPNLTRGLLRTAYEGHPPPTGILVPALARLAIPKPGKVSDFAHRNLQHCLVAAIKLSLTYGKEEAKTLETLDPGRNVQGYLCGRLLAVLEEAQRRAATGKLNSTLVDRFFGSVSATPCAYLPTLIRLAESGHLPKIRRENRGFAEIDGILQDILARLDDAGGLPRRLPLAGQGEFALGFYHERAEFAARRAQRQGTATTAAPGGKL